MCETFYTNDEGKCEIGFSSTKAGSECTVNSDCQDSLGRDFKCSCSSVGSSKKYCDTGPEDEEWSTARLKYWVYLQGRVFESNSLGTKHCHVANRQGECERKDLYYDFRCAEMKAMYYTVLKNLQSCLTEIKGGNSLFGLYYKFCESLSDKEKGSIPLLLDFNEKEAVYNKSFLAKFSIVLYLLLVSVLL